MRLLNSSTYQLHEFNEPEKPYAIFSHTWGSDEVSLQDYQESIAQTKKGFQKIKLCCDQAAKDKIPWVWIDTCCMNRLDSAERSEVLHSNYKWLENATKCYAYLSDVSSSADSWESTFKSCKWFTRQFTLQELVAPPEVVFFAQDWVQVGTRKSLHSIISGITGIQPAVLTGEKKPKQCHVSERMSWASNREAKAVEDKAYALMGLFDIKLPVLYGEGNRAFRRLQDEIRKTHNDTARTGIRLLITNSEPLELKYFPASDSPEYAILSHTWAIQPEEEISFLDVGQGRAASKGSYQKVKKCCRLAAEHGFEYLWVDTCCIDKSSSAELQEAICSMYRWYVKFAEQYYLFLIISMVVVLLLPCSYSLWFPIFRVSMFPKHFYLLPTLYDVRKLILRFRAGTNRLKFVMFILKTIFIPWLHLRTPTCGTANGSREAGHCVSSASMLANERLSANIVYRRTYSPYLCGVLRQRME
jgi:hypothetical protein